MTKKQFYNRCFYPLIRQLQNGKISRELFEFQWAELQTIYKAMGR